MADIAYIPDGNNQANNILPWMLAAGNGGFGGFGGFGGGLGIDLMGEGPAYLSGDTMRELADIVCRLGCEHCRQ